MQQTNQTYTIYTSSSMQETLVEGGGMGCTHPPVGKLPALFSEQTTTFRERLLKKTCKGDVLFHLDNFGRVTHEDVELSDIPDFGGKTIVNSNATKVIFSADTIDSAVFEASCYCHQGKNVVMMGHAGVGKTTLVPFAAFSRLTKESLVVLVQPTELMAEMAYESSVARHPDKSHFFSYFDGEGAIAKSGVVVMSANVAMNLFFATKAGGSGIKNLTYVFLDEAHTLSPVYEVLRRLFSASRMSVDVISLTATKDDDDYLRRPVGNAQGITVHKEKFFETIDWVNMDFEARWMSRLHDGRWLFVMPNRITVQSLAYWLKNVQMLPNVYCMFTEQTQKKNIKAFKKFNDRGKMSAFMVITADYATGLNFDCNNFVDAAITSDIGFSNRSGCFDSCRFWTMSEKIQRIGRSNRFETTGNIYTHEEKIPHHFQRIPKVTTMRDKYLDAYAALFNYYHKGHSNKFTRKQAFVLLRCLNFFPLLTGFVSRDGYVTRKYLSGLKPLFTGVLSAQDFDICDVVDMEKDIETQSYIVHMVCKTPFQTVHGHNAVVSYITGYGEDSVVAAVPYDDTTSVASSEASSALFSDARGRFLSMSTIVTAETEMSSRKQEKEPVHKVITSTAQRRDQRGDVGDEENHNSSKDQTASVLNTSVGRHVGTEMVIQDVKRDEYTDSCRNHVETVSGVSVGCQMSTDVATRGFSVAPVINHDRCFERDPLSGKRDLGMQSMPVSMKAATDGLASFNPITTSAFADNDLEEKYRAISKEMIGMISQHIPVPMGAYVPFMTLYKTTPDDFSKLLNVEPLSLTAKTYVRGITDHAVDGHYYTPAVDLYPTVNYLEYSRADKKLFDSVKYRMSSYAAESNSHLLEMMRLWCKAWNAYTAELIDLGSNMHFGLMAPLTNVMSKRRISIILHQRMPALKKWFQLLYSRGAYCVDFGLVQHSAEFVDGWVSDTIVRASEIPFDDNVGRIVVSDGQTRETAQAAIIGCNVISCYHALERFLKRMISNGGDVVVTLIYPRRISLSVHYVDAINDIVVYKFGDEVNQDPFPSANVCHARAGLECYMLLLHRGVDSSGEIVDRVSRTSNFRLIPFNDDRSYALSAMEGVQAGNSGALVVCATENSVVGIYTGYNTIDRRIRISNLQTYHLS